MILFLYLLYPILRILIRKWAVPVTVLLTFLYFMESIAGIQPSVPPDASVFTACMLFWIGMLFQEFPRLLKPALWKTIMAVLLSCLVMFVKLPYIGNVLPWKNLLGIAVFYLLNFLFSWISYSERISGILKYLSSISFAVYLLHHFMIFRVLERFGDRETGIIYCVSLAATGAAAIMVTFVSGQIRKYALKR